MSQKIKSVLVANRGEIAIRIMRTAADNDLRSVAIYAEDDAKSLHLQKADEAIALQGRGAAAYLNAGQVVEKALSSGSDAVHPGYGFLSENADFAALCEKKGLVFVGPTPEQLSLFGDKARARALAQETGVPLLPGTLGVTSLEEGKAFMESLGEGGAVMIKALAGGGGRGMRPVYNLAEFDEAYARCQSEAKTAFGSGDVYVEQFLPRARHIEVQIVGDGQGGVCHLYERECSLQRRNQKVLEIAPSPSLPQSLRDKLTAAAITLAKKTNYRSLGTFEFLLDQRRPELTDETPFFFMEANPRVQVEHTVTEEITGFDLIGLQLAIAEGKTLAELGLVQADIPAPRGFAVQLRINMETMDKTGAVHPSGGTLSVFEMPSGPGVRNDGYGYSGYTTSPSYDSLLAKLIVHSTTASYPKVLDRAYRALCEYKIVGVPTNIGFLQNLMKQEAVQENAVYTRYIEDHIADLAEGEEGQHLKLYIETEAGASDAIQDDAAVAPAGSDAVSAPMQGAIVSIDVAVGEAVKKGQQLLIMEAMKMEHVIQAPFSGVVTAVPVDAGSVVFANNPLLFVELSHSEDDEGLVEEKVDLDHIRQDLQDVYDRHALGLDAARPDAVAKRRKTGHRTTRENITDLCDEGSFVEYGALVIAAQRRRRDLKELIERTPADGIVTGVGSVNGEYFEESRVAVMSYDYTVMAGTQGVQNHRKKDRMCEIVEKTRVPIIVFAEGGGGRPGDTDAMGISGLDCESFYMFGRLSGTVPLVGVTTGRCFAGNAALLGCCDVIIATEGSNIGMGGPAMIEGGGLGQVKPEDVGPFDVQRANGVIDVPVKDEAEAVVAAKKYISYFQGTKKEWECRDQRELRHVVPENRLRAYDLYKVFDILFDIDSVLEVRPDFGKEMVTAFVRVEGRPVGVIANNPSHTGGAITSTAADKAARFMRLCDNFGIPILFLCDTPGIMVGPEAEKSGTVRHASRLMVTGANLTVPFFTIVLRKAYGLGALTMAGGSFKAALFAVSWPTGEMGPMGLEGSVKLGFRRELEAIEDPAEQKAEFDRRVEELYQHGKALNVASHFEIDDVIDPVDSRYWIISTLDSVKKDENNPRHIRRYIDTW